MKISDILDRPIAFHRVFVTLTGSVKAGILLSQAVYWQARAKQDDGFWYKTAEEWEEETGLTRREQEKARRDAGKYLATDLRGVPATLYYRVDDEALLNALISLLGESSFDKKGKLDSPKEENIKRNAETTRDSKPDILDAELAQAMKVQALKIATDALETAFGVKGWPWNSRSDWDKFALWTLATFDTDPTAFQDYAEWRRKDGRYQGAMTNPKIRESPQKFMDTGWPTFLAAQAMYGNQEGDNRPEYKPVPAEDESRFVPAPPRRPK